ncbi:MAG: hypothetical protein J6A12_03860 [Oscillospiraceae bacterium]|nr:hypothetical protein [Oscillospiraceae bacterium]MBQ7937683.1 hypothetical protein [Oscillospiraceae bacterium]
MNGDGKFTVILVIAAIIISFFMAMADGGGSSSSSSEPWRDLGVSEREYKQVYNYYKYGEWS